MKTKKAFFVTLLVLFFFGSAAEVRALLPSTWCLSAAGALYVGSLVNDVIRRTALSDPRHQGLSEADATRNLKVGLDAIKREPWFVVPAYLFLVASVVVRTFE
ncbi:MAG: hypothetical protein M1549_00460 [Candidatus Dependentiae bacterium]|nr:hypothetical protein [Candidatus Dependentiae bacterium]